MSIKPSNITLAFSEEVARLLAKAIGPERMAKESVAVAIIMACSAHDISRMMINQAYDELDI